MDDQVKNVPIGEEELSQVPEEGSQEADKGEIEIPEIGRSFKNQEELKKAYMGAVAQMQEATTKLAQKEREEAAKVIPPTSNEVLSEQEKMAREAVKVLGDYDIKPASETKKAIISEVEQLLELREFVGAKNATVRYDDQRLVKEDEKKLLERYRAGIPFEETYWALKGQANMKHAKDGDLAFTPRKSGNSLSTEVPTQPKVNIPLGQNAFDDEHLSESLEKIFSPFIEE